MRDSILNSNFFLSGVELRDDADLVPFVLDILREVYDWPYDDRTYPSSFEIISNSNFFVII
jgi:hypothetical protein